MKHYLRFLITMLLLVLFGGGSYGQTWQKVELKDLTSGDVFVIAEIHNLKSSYAMSNDKGTSAPTAVSIKLSEDGTTITSTVADNLKWNVGKDGNAYIFYPNGNNKKWLYCTKSENVLKVGTGVGKTFELYKDNNYSGLKNITCNRYIGVYNKKDWRSYTQQKNDIIHDNIKGQQIAFYKYVNDTRIATTLAFKETSGSVNIGETFTLPELTLKAGEEVLTGRTFKYSSSAQGVASIDENTGAVTIHSAGNTVLTAKFEDLDGKYKQSSADFTLKVIDPNAIVFSAADKSFDGLGAYDESKNKAVTKTFKSASGKPYSFTIFYCTKGSSNKAGCLQMKSGLGYVTSPSFETSFPYGYKVAVYYTTGTSGVLENLTISSNPSLEVKSTTEESGGGTADDPEYVTTISLPDPSATFTMTANSRVKYVSRIELTPLAAPEIETVTLDETANNDDVVKNNAGKTVNVTLKRTISDTYLNPFCVPFDMTADQITAVFGEGCVVSAFTSVTGKVMNFEKVTTIAAGQPYIVQATKASTEISLDKVEMKSESESKVVKESSELSMSFNGIVSPYTFKKNDGTELFLDKNGNLRYPSTVGSQMKGMRAYFEVLDGTSNEAKVNIGGGLSSIDKLMNGEAMTGKVYNLNGQYVGNTLDGLAKGLYIMNGKKYVVK